MRVSKVFVLCFAELAKRYQNMSNLNAFFHLNIYSDEIMFNKVGIYKQVSLHSTAMP